MYKLRKVLLIDDDSTTLYINERIVREMRFAEEIELLRNGKDGFKYIQKHCDNSPESCPDLVILDHHMPVMDGLEMMENLQEIGILSKIRAVFLLLAVNSEEQDIRKFMELGVQEYTQKPLSKETLLDAYQKYWADDTVRDHVANKK
ncbi:response regulator [Pontibacter sp. SGAir0037]|uniref:response regulator n=1 Tax=Pontibacter sp. SGAir0037 TaxID=2571030 RepID=UPI0010CD453F|nr:response regulator [Pontibacter sp. SGAir0037]QCR21577.1 hypothetical protein C1N53_03915 [Pontibacter sp. SGAir0037]